MPFMRGAMPLRRTLYHLQQGKIVLRDDVAIMMFGYHKTPKREQVGASDFIFWHWAQLQFKNPDVQIIKQVDMCVTPFALAFLHTGREVLFDLENKNKDEIVDLIQGTLGKSELVKQREYLEKMQDNNPAEFGENCKRHCLCEIQGQRSCTALMPAPDYLKGKWRWNHNVL